MRADQGIPILGYLGDAGARGADEDKPILAHLEGAGEMRADEGPAKMPHLGDARDQVGDMVGVSPRYVSYAARVKEDAPAAFEELRAGTITMPQAKVIARAR